MDQQLLGKCGFFCGSCPTYLKDQCPGCLEAHTAGDCCTRDCVLAKNISFCGQCGHFPCDMILTRPKSTVLDPNWLIWKAEEPPFDMEAYWKAVLDQDASSLPRYFADDAVIRWHNTDEQFTVSEFVRANCEYPGQWQGEIQRQEQHGALLTTVARVRSGEASFHVTSFFRIRNGVIESLDEYWGDDGPAPQWRQDLRLGRPIAWSVDFVPATLEDLHTIAVLRRAVWDTTYRGIHTDEMIAQFDFPWHAQKDRVKILDGSFHVYLLRHENHPVGYLIYQLKNDILHLHSLNLLPESQRRGIGRTALEHVSRFGKDHGLSRFQLQCSPWNQNAMDFYKAMGGIIFREDLHNEERYMDAVWFEFRI